MAAKLTYNQRRFLADAAKGASGMAIQSITQPSYTALDKRGLVKWERTPPGFDGRWVITEAGRAVLAQQ